MDIMPTIAELVGINMPNDRVIDGKSFKKLLTVQTKENIHESLYFWREAKLYAMRYGPYKVHFKTRSGFKLKDKGKNQNPPLIF